MLVGGTWLLLASSAGAFLGSNARVDAPLDDAWSRQKRWLTVGDLPVACIEQGPADAPPLVMLHGCPFSSVIWQRVMERFAANHRVIAPDLPGLGDTQVSLADDYRLPREARVVLELLDRLGIARANFLVTDHGAAVLQVLLSMAPERIGRVVISNAEAYDTWPSEPELPYLRAVVNPVLGPLFKALLGFQFVRREVFSIATADPASLDDVMLTAFVESHTASPARWQRLVRFYRWQLDPEHRAETMRAVPFMRAFREPVLVLWGSADGNFGKAVAERLAADFPNARLERVEHAGHLPMLEQPERYATAATRFLDGAVP